MLVLYSFITKIEIINAIMKSLVHYIQEKLIIKKNKNVSYKYFPETKDELKK